MNPPVCLVMIVRDSGSDLIPVLRAAKPYLSSYFIADTGSVDSTPEIVASELDGVSGRLVHHPWVHFSHNRNLVLEGAESAYPNSFYLMLDDSYILHGGEHLLEALRGLDPAVSANYLVRIFDKERFYYSARLMTAGQRYKYRIHEVPIDPAKGSLDDRIYLSDPVSVLHHQRSKKRYERDIDWLMMDRTDFPDDPRPVFYLGRTYYIKDDLKNAVEMFQQRIRMARADHAAGSRYEIYDSMFYLSVISYKKFLQVQTKETFQVTLELLRKCHTTFPYRAEPLYYLAIIMIYFEYEQRKDEILETLEKAASLSIPEDNDVLYDVYKEKIPYTLSFTYYRMGKYDQAVETIKKNYPAEPHLKYDNLLIGMGALKPYSIQHFSEPLVVIHAGSVVQRPWNGANLHSGCSGSEFMAVQLAEYFARCRKRVVLFCECAGLEAEVNGVVYRPAKSYYSFLRTHYIDVLVVSRDSAQLSYLRHIKNVFLWVHDTEPIGDEFQTAPSFRGVISLSKWHKGHILSSFPMPSGHIKIIGNVIQPIPALLDTPKRPMRFIFSSSPDRGLDRVVEIIERIAETYPDVSLAVYANDHLIEGRLKNLMAEKPDRYLLRPRAAKDVLHAAYAEADYWLYPTGFTETYCITAVEAQYYRCVCVTTGLASLADTVADRGVLLTSRYEQDAVVDEAVRKIDFLQKNELIKEMYRQRGHEWASHQIIDEIGPQWDSLIQL